MLNDVSTYTDDYGNEKMLSVTDHTPKKSFSFSLTTKEEIEKFKTEKQKILEDRKNAVRSVDSITLQSLLKVYDHMLLYDTEKEEFLWDTKKLEEVMNDGMCLEYLENCIEQSYVSNKR